jgi:hypothetical protein
MKGGPGQDLSREPAWQLLGQFGEAAAQVLGLGVVDAERERLLVGRARLGYPAQAAQQLGAGGVPPRIADQVADLLDQARPAAGPSPSATATARLRRATGVSCTVSSTSYQEMTASQSVSA